MISVCISNRKAWKMRCYGVGVLCWMLSDWIIIQFTLTTALCSDTPSHLVWLSGTIICFSPGQWPKTPIGFVWAIWPRRVMVCCLRWHGLHNHPTSTPLRWFGMSWTAEWRKSSQHVLNICGNSFKTVGKAFQVKLVERMPRVCKAVIKAKDGYFEESQI